MKKKLASILLAVTLSMSMTAQMGVYASEFDILDSGEESSGAYDSEDAFFADQTEGTSEETGEMISSDGISLFSEEFLPEEVTEEEPGREEVLRPVISADGSVIVQKTDWQRTEDGAYRLIKSRLPQASAGEEELLSGEETEAADPVYVEEYYTQADGIVKITTVSGEESHTGYYLFDENGKMQTGEQMIAPGTKGYEGEEAAQMYFVPQEEAVLYPEFENAEEVVTDTFTSNVGQQLLGTWNYKNGRFSYYNEKGVFTSVANLTAQGADNGMGYFEIDGAYYVLDEQGVPATGLTTVKDSLYYLQPDSKIPGQMFVSGWKNLSDEKGARWIYFQRVSREADRGKAVTHTGNFASTITPISRTTKFLMDKDGYVLKNAHVVLENGKTYVGSKENGSLNKNRLVEYDGVRYYFDAAGSQVKWVNSYMLCPGLGTYYYFGSTPGAVEERHGYQKVTDASGKYIGWFYYDEKGDPLRFRFYDNRFFVDLGKSVGGFRDTNSNGVYFFATSNENQLKGTYYRNTLVHSKGKYYYAQSDGHLLKEGFVTIQGNRYAFKNYVLLFNTLEWINGTYGYIDAYGIFHTGWCISSNSANRVMYVDPTGNGFYRNTSVVIDGLRYYFDANGNRINDLTDRYKGPYYLRVDRINGVMTIYDSTRTVPVKSIRVSVGLPGTPTPTGTYRLRSYGRWVSLMGPSWGQYGTHVEGAGQGGIFVHSIACTYANPYNVPAGAYNALGSPASHGCIRCCVADAKWVYDHCNGATITIFDGKYNANEALKGPLGRRALVPITGNYDPTDPSV